MMGKSGRGWSTFGFGVGVVASISANVEHSYVGARPALGAIVAAGFWPVGLLIALEVISRVHWPKGWQWWLTRYAGLTTVALIAAVVSYRHMSGLLRSYGEDGFSAGIGPLAIDGLMVVCSVALLAIADNQRQQPENRHEVVPTGGVAPAIIPLDDPLPSVDQEPIQPKLRGGDELKAKAITWVREYTGDRTLTGQLVGQEFGRSQTWGRGILREAR